MLTEVGGQVRRWLADPRQRDSRLVLLTRQAVRTDPGGPLGSLALAPLPGWLRRLQSEHPHRVVLADLEPGPATDLVPMAASGEPRLAFRDGVALVPRLVRVAVEPEADSQLSAGPVLISGAHTSEAGILARHLVAGQRSRN